MWVISPFVVIIIAPNAHIIGQVRNPNQAAIRSWSQKRHLMLFSQRKAMAAQAKYTVMAEGTCNLTKDYMRSDSPTADWYLHKISLYDYCILWSIKAIMHFSETVLSWGPRLLFITSPNYVLRYIQAKLAIVYYIGLLRFSSLFIDGHYLNENTIGNDSLYLIIIRSGITRCATIEEISHIQNIWSFQKLMHVICIFPLFSVWFLTSNCFNVFTNDENWCPS